MYCFFGGGVVVNFCVSPVKQKRDICIAFRAAASLAA